MANISFFVVLAIYVMAGLLLHEDVNIHVPDPYMDEIFHVPQCEQFCRNNFSHWDPKITTLPGSYIATFAILDVVNLFYDSDLCNAFWMRGICLLFSVGNFCLIYQIIGIRYKGLKALNRSLATLSISTFPVLYFFSFLYYTDVFSTFFILLAYKYHLVSINEENYNDPMPLAIFFCQFAAAFSVFVRQTNIVWVNYICTDQGLAYFCRYIVPVQEQQPQPEAKTKPKGSNKKARKRRNSAGQAHEQKVREQSFSKQFPRFAEMFMTAHRTMAFHGSDPENSNIHILFSGLRFTGFLIINLSFAAFIVWNKGIAVGDRSAHQVTLNIPQIFYFLLFTAIMAFPLTFLHALRILRTTRWSRRIIFNCLSVITLFLIIIHLNTTAHPYLLADNRHYTFYVWKRLFQWFPVVKYLLAPVYFLIMYIVLQMFDINFTCNWCGNIVYLTFCFLNLVPQQLLEFRYFIPAYLIFRLNIGEFRKRFVFLELLWYCALNSATFYMFLHKPFLWPSSSDPQRFMW